ncbi:hypothetical protein M433DRAFT_208986 [Acidomyces richmondensis BFW]|nr:hypothetical protein M433DRAFT_208986 [Acidomyces richmondensis BFW]
MHHWLMLFAVPHHLYPLDLGAMANHSVAKLTGRAYEQSYFVLKEMRLPMWCARIWISKQPTLPSLAQIARVHAIDASLCRYFLIW